jgi:hypothetical protein
MADNLICFDVDGQRRRGRAIWLYLITVVSDDLESRLASSFEDLLNDLGSRPVKEDRSRSYVT